jgi:hypothetical protein
LPDERATPEKAPAHRNAGEVILGSTSIEVVQAFRLRVKLRRTAVAFAGGWSGLRWRADPRVTLYILYILCGLCGSLVQTSVVRFVVKKLEEQNNSWSLDLLFD